jgi:hypothetical protein
MYTQLKPANLNVVGIPGECLVYVREVFGVSAKYPTATSGWENASYKHIGEQPPTDVDVPVWFSWNVDGHVGVSVPGEGVYSALERGVEVKASVAVLATAIGGTYLGWSEDVDGVRIVQPATPAPTQMPAIGSHVQLIPPQTRTTYKAGTTTQAGTIHVTDDTFVYEVRGYDPKYPNRIIINSASAGGNGVALSLYYFSGALIPGWKVV